MIAMEGGDVPRSTPGVRTVIAVTGVLLSGSYLACDSAPTREPVGSVGRPCAPDGTCDEGLSCNVNGRCEAPSVCTGDGGPQGCGCGAGLVERDGACVPAEGACEGVDCSGHGSCAIEAGAASCVCAAGHRAEGLACVPLATTCEGVTCSGHGTCFVVDQVIEDELAADCEDTFVNGGTDTVNYADDGESLKVYTWPDNTAANRIILRCDFSRIPADASIESATLSLYMHGVEGNGGDAVCDVAAMPIVNVTPVISACTWATYDGTSPWTGGATGGGNDVGTSAWVTSVATTAGYYDWQLTSMVRDWVAAPATNGGLILDADTSAAADTNRLFRPLEHAEEARRPKVTVRYTLPGSSAVTCQCNSGFVVDGLDCVPEATDSDAGPATDAGPDVGSDGGTEVTHLFTDGFESGDLSKTENGFRWAGTSFGGNGDAVGVSTDIAHTGTRSLKLTFGGGPPDDDAWAEQRFDIGQDVQELWMEWFQYFPDGTEGLGPKWVHRDDRPNNNKFFRLWDVDYSSYQVKIGMSSGFTSGGDSVLFGEYGTEGRGVGFAGSTGSGPGAGIDESGVGDDRRGRWVHFTVHVRLATAANNDGLLELYVDGAPTIASASLPLYPSGGAGNFLRNGYLMGWANSGFVETSHTYIDDFAIWLGP